MQARCDVGPSHFPVKNIGHEFSVVSEEPRMPDPSKDNQGPNPDPDEPGDEDGKDKPAKPANPLSRWPMGWLLLIGMAVVLLLIMGNGSRKAVDINWQQFYGYAERGEIKDGEIVSKESTFYAELTEDAMVDGEVKEAGVRISTYVHPESIPKREREVELLNEREGDGHEFLTIQTKKPSSGLLTMILLNFLPLILICFLIYFFIFRPMRGGGGGPGGMLGSFGRSKHKVLTKEHSSVTLANVAGIEEAKDEVTEVIEFLKNPKRFQRLGGRVPRGVLLIGPPGCGKTLLAKAVAGEADVPFFSISGSDFVEMFVGVGASRVRDLFKQAKDSAPCIIFLDEIDAVGRRRGAGFSSGGNDEREQTLNAILVEMDGFDSSDQVIVLASTNRADVLDPALTRPGRFDRAVQVHLPDVKGRYDILKVHGRKIKMSPDVDLERLARGTPMLSGAELEAIINEAAIAATLQNKEWVEMEDLEEARDKVKYGRSRKSARIEEEEKEVIAYHEAGHAVITYHDEHAEPLHKVTIIPRGQSLGATFMLPEKDRHIMGKRRLLAMMRVSYGGRIAEQMFCNDQYNGTAGDIRQATSIARAMVTEYGMSDKVGFQLFAGDDNGQPWSSGDSISDDTAQLIDEEIRALIDTTYSQAVKIIEDHKQQVEDLAKALLKYESLTFDEVDRIMKGQELGKATVSDLLMQELETPLASTPPKPSADSDPEADDPPGVMPSPA